MLQLFLVQKLKKMFGEKTQVDSENSSKKPKSIQKILQKTLSRFKKFFKKKPKSIQKSYSQNGKVNFKI